MVKARMIEGVPHVDATDVRRNLTTVGDEILSQFPRVVVMKNGAPWLVITRAEETDAGNVVIFGGDNGDDDDTEE